MLLRYVVRFLIYSSLYMYLGLLTTLHTFYSFDIYDDVCFLLLSHMCWFFSLFMHIFLSLYNLSIFHT